MTMESQMKIREFITSCDYFSNLPAEGMNAIESIAELISLPESDILFNQGDMPDFFYILTSGNLFAFLTNTSGKKITVGQIIPFEPVGELSTLALKPRGMTIIAKVDSTLLRLPIHPFKEICIKYPFILADLSQYIVKRFLQTLKVMANETSNINIMLMYANNPANIIIKNKIAALNNPDLLIATNKTIKTDEIESKINTTSLKQLDLLFIMEEWDPAFLDELKKWLTHVYIIVNEEEKEFTNISKTILFELNQISHIRNELIILHADNKNKIDNTRKWLDKADITLHHHIKINETNDISRLVRFMTGKAITLVLGGGGAKGLSHLGVIKGILNRNLPIDAIGGTSIGAAVAACYALNLNYDQALIFIRKLKTASVKSIQFTNLVWPIVSLFSSDPATTLLIYLMNNMLIEDLPIPYFAVASNIKNKNAVIIKQGLIWGSRS